jgi:hypothetical protein
LDSFPELSPGSQTAAIVQLHFIGPAYQWMHGKDSGDVDDPAAVDSREPGRIQSAFQPGQGFAQQIALRPAVVKTLDEGGATATEDLGAVVFR